MSDFPFSESLSSFFSLGGKFVEILFDVLKDEIGLIDYSDNFFHSNDIGVIHFAEGFNFCQLKALFPGAVLFFKPFDGNYFLGLFILSHFNVSE